MVSLDVIFSPAAHLYLKLQYMITAAQLITNAQYPTIRISNKLLEGIRAQNTSKRDTRPWLDSYPDMRQIAEEQRLDVFSFNRGFATSPLANFKIFSSRSMLDSSCAPCGLNQMRRPLKSQRCTLVLTI